MKQQILVIHGGDAFDSYDEYLDNLKKKVPKPEKFKSLGWKGFLQQDLGESFDVLSPTMPNAQNAKYLEWEIWFNKIIPFLDEELIVIGHSLGGMFIV